MVHFHYKICKNSVIQAMVNKSTKKVRYGRGKYAAHPDYIKYMEMIVRHPNYKGMPNAMSKGRVNWQVSSGKTTSFYKYYLQRFSWWVKKADKLKVPGSGNSSDRFSITARLIHPTGYRTCRLCGQERNVGYFYTNKVFAVRINKTFPGVEIIAKMPLDEVLGIFSSIPKDQLADFFTKLFPERKAAFKKFGVTAKAFEKTNHIRSAYLSPGFMCNPPDRLDGFHDYCINCRELRDPGRSKENLRSYIHDRRTFELWSEGDWVIADTLYASAGSGVCEICEKKLRKVSPDHVGPLACGFKQLPLFRAMCPSCNSSKNRRLRLDDIAILLEYEKRTGESVASWQVRELWDRYKHKIETDAQAKELSDFMRSLQDFFLRTLFELYKAGYSEFLSTLLHPEYAFFKVKFEDLNTGTFQYSGYTKIPIDTKLRNSLANRVIRIAFEELKIYNQKGILSRKVRKYFHQAFLDLQKELVQKAKEVKIDAVGSEWNNLMKSSRKSDQKTRRIEFLRKKTKSEKYSELQKKLKKTFLEIGKKTTIPLGFT